MKNWEAFIGGLGEGFKPGRAPGAGAALILALVPAPVPFFHAG
jgi:hypothetical protein